MRAARTILNIVSMSLGSFVALASTDITLRVAAAVSLSFAFASFVLERLE